MTVEQKNATWQARYVDIGINLTDPVYQGIYHNTQRHPPDLPAVIQRARAANCTKLIITGSDLASSHAAVALAQTYPKTCYATVGVHPCSSSQFTCGPTPAATQLAELQALAQTAKAAGQAVALGEIGLDYDRLSLCPQKTQVEFFRRQLDVAVAVQLPLFLHSRAAHADFIALLDARTSELPRRGVVHSFTGSRAEMDELLAKGWDIGLNGCSFKTDANCDVARAVPLDRLHLETDGPWCEIRPSHASARELARMESDGVRQPEESTATRWVKKEKWEVGVCVKGRNEPCTIPKVARVVAGLKELDVREVIDAAWANSVRMFGLDEISNDAREPDP
ncbi:hypothetical protein K3495_g2506 [Podosphaera aphanis]|nr:hypothetical protein K3495_g2506 [Podosphaera aphanis]